LDLPAREFLPYNGIIDLIIRAANSVHHCLGPGHREHWYRQALGDTIADLGLVVIAEQAVPLAVEGRTCSWLYPDLVVDHTVVVECKVSPCWLSDSDVAQILTYLAVCRLPVGVLLNFGLPRLEYRRTLRPTRPDEWIQRVAPYRRLR
jgi:GxxExxY protein